VQLQLVTAAVKLFLKKPQPRAQQMIQLVLTYATQVRIVRLPSSCSPRPPRRALPRRPACRCLHAVTRYEPEWLQALSISRATLVCGLQTPHTLDTCGHKICDPLLRLWAAMMLCLLIDLCAGRCVGSY